MTRAEKFTTIYNAFKAIKTAIIGKGVTVSGDISTFADAINSIPVGSEVLTGMVSGTNSKNLTITDAIGKDNIAVFLISTSSSGVSGNMITSAGYINESIYMTGKASSNTVNISTDASYDKSTGKISYTGSRAEYVFTYNTYFKYIYVAW